MHRLAIRRLDGRGFDPILPRFCRLRSMGTLWRLPRSAAVLPTRGDVSDNHKQLAPHRLYRSPPPFFSTFQATHRRRCGICAQVRCSPCSLSERWGNADRRATAGRRIADVAAGNAGLPERRHGAADGAGGRPRPGRGRTPRAWAHAKKAESQHAPGCCGRD